MVSNQTAVFYPALLCFLLFACSPTDQDRVDRLSGPEAEITDLFTIDDSSLPEDQLFGTIQQVLVAKSGELLIVDSQQRTIHLFDGNGNYIDSELREGEGPGEVRRIGRVSLSDRNELLLYDWSQRRLSRYSLETESEPGIRPVADMNPEFYPRDFHTTPEGDMFCMIYPGPADPASTSIQIQKIDEDGGADGEPLIEFAKDEVLEFRNESGQMLATTSSPHHKKILPYFHRNRLIAGNSSTVGFETYSLSTGERIDSVGFTRPDVELSAEERREFVETMTERMGFEGIEVSSMVNQMPETKGKVRRLHYDPDGVIWLNLVTDEESGVPHWIALGESGEVLGQISDELPGSVLQIHRGRIYLLAETDSGARFIEVLQYEV